MANIIEIITREIVEGKGNIAGVGKELDTVQEKADGVNSGQKSLADTFKGSWTEISSKLDVGAQAIQLVGEAYSEVVGTYIDYAEQVRNISQVTGESAEEVSRLLQVTDDYKVDAEKLTQVMKKMATEGFAFTTDSLADLSDEYLKIQDPVERTNFLFDTFGREGEAFAEIMLQGGDAIREQSDAVSENLILTQQSLDQARDYEIAMDNLNDSIEGVKIVIGQELIPILISLADATNNNITMQLAHNKAKELGMDVTRGLFQETFKLNGELVTNEELIIAIANAEREQIAAFAEANPEVERATTYISNYGSGTQEAASQTDMFGYSVLGATDALAQANAEFGFVISFSKQYESNIDRISKAEDELTSAQNELNELMAIGWSASSDKVVTAQQKVDGLTGKLNDAKQASVDATNEMIAGFLQAQLAADGSFTEADIKKVLDYRLAVGLLTKEAYDAALNALAIANNLLGIPTEINLNVHTNYTSSGYGGSQGSQIPVATGGGIMPGSMLFDGSFADGGGFGSGNYLWNESAQSRPEVFVGGGGYVLTKQDAMNALGMGGGGGGAVIVVNYSPMFSMGDRAEMETVLIPLLKEQLGL